MAGIPGKIVIAGRSCRERDCFSTRVQLGKQAQSGAEKTPRAHSTSATESGTPYSSKVSTEAENDYTVAIKMGKLSHSGGLYLESTAGQG